MRSEGKEREGKSEPLIEVGVEDVKGGMGRHAAVGRAEGKELERRLYC